MRRRRSEKVAGSLSKRDLVRRGLAIFVGWSAPQFSAFIDHFDGESLRWWSVKRPEVLCEQFDFLSAGRRKRLLALHRRGAEKLAEQVASWPGEVILYDSKWYPPGLGDLSAPPAAVHIRGDLRSLLRPGLAVVGSRKIGVSAASSARRILEPAVRGGMVIVSGGALGADTVAHRCAVDLGAATISVLPCGLCNLAPKSNRQLFSEIADGRGALISEYPPQRGVRKYHFKRRNSLIAAISRGVLVLRAGRKSGTMLTVEAADKLGRPLGAMPGTPQDPLCRGCHHVLRHGGRMIAEPDDLRSWWETLAPEVTPTEEANDEVTAASSSISLPDCEVLRCATGLLDEEGAFSMEALARETGKSAAELQTVLLGHELSGVIERVAGGDRYRLQIGDYC